MLGQVNTETLQEKAYRAIRDSIMRNDLVPGQPLSIDELARDLGVSPTPVREALARLISDGLVERTPNKTACVTKIAEEDVHQSYEVRRLIEPYMTGVAARKTSTTPDLRERLIELQEKTKRIKPTLKSGSIMPSLRDAQRSSGLEFNAIVFDALEHELLKRVFSLISDHSLRIRLSTESSSLASNEKSVTAMIDEHLAIFDALLAGDERRAEQAVKDHLNKAEMRTVEASRETSRRVPGGTERTPDTRD